MAPVGGRRAYVLCTGKDPEIKMPTILVIDDTPSMVDLFREVLVTRGYDVSVCLVASRATAMIEESQPHAVILDIVMPEVSGWDILAWLRAREQTQRLPVIVCTAWAEAAAGRLRDHPDPAAWLLPKPFDTGELEELLSEALNRR
ncbi:MAG: response regulator [Chloroflexi bacterium]|nr:response regulator [Chloroflexota bacterium]